MPWQFRPQKIPQLDSYSWVAKVTPIPLQPKILSKRDPAPKSPQWLETPRKGRTHVIFFWNICQYQETSYEDLPSLWSSAEHIQSGQSLKVQPEPNTNLKKISSGPRLAGKHQRRHDLSSCKKGYITNFTSLVKVIIRIHSLGSWAHGLDHFMFKVLENKNQDRKAHEEG